MSNRAVWQYLAPMDRETFLSGVICWLLDPRGDHGLEDRLLSVMLDEIGYTVEDSREGQSHGTDEALEVRPEVVGQDKRFDISVFDRGRQIAVFEVKCKTFGSPDQIRKYAETGLRVGRIAFGEWNFPELCDEERVTYPLITFTDLARMLKQVSNMARTPLVTSFAEQIELESGFFRKMRGFFIDETEPKPPDLPTVHRFSDRFCNQLFWHWFLEKSSKESIWGEFEVNSKSEQSGVWCAIEGTQFKVPRRAVFPKLALELSGKFEYWIHIEFDNGTGILSKQGEQVGSIQIRIWDDDGSREDLFSAIQEASVGCGF